MPAFSKDSFPRAQ